MELRKTTRPGWQKGGGGSSSRWHLKTQTHLQGAMPCTRSEAAGSPAWRVRAMRGPAAQAQWRAAPAAARLTAVALVGAPHLSGPARPGTAPTCQAAAGRWVAPPAGGGAREQRESGNVFALPAPAGLQACAPCAACPVCPVIQPSSPDARPARGSPYKQASPRSPAPPRCAVGSGAAPAGTRCR